MGDPMARQLLNAGHDVALWSHTASKAEALARTGKGRFCATPQEAASHSDVVFYCVGDSAMSEQTARAVLEGLPAGGTAVDCSTVSPEVSRGIHKAYSEKGRHFLDAPCTGSKPGAEKGTLTFMIGGALEVFERTRDCFLPMGKLLYYCGGPGMGLHAKLTQNLILANIMQAFSEGMVLATKAGVDPKLMLEILDNSAAKSGLIAFKAPYVLRRDFSTNFATKWMHKDVGLALDSGKDLGVPLPITGLTQQIFQAALSAGYSEDDFCSLVRVLEQLGGVEIKVN